MMLDKPALRGRAATPPGIAEGFVFAAGGLVAGLAPKGMAGWLFAAALLAAFLLLRTRRAPLPASRFFVGLAPAGAPLAGIAVLFVGYYAAAAAWSPSPRAWATVAEIGAVFLATLALRAWLDRGPALGSAESPAVPPVAGAGADSLRFGRWLLAGTAAGLAFALFEVISDYAALHVLNGFGIMVMAKANIPKQSAVIFGLAAWPLGLFVERRHGRAAGLALVLAGAAAAFLLTSRSAFAGMGAGLFVLAVGYASTRAAALLVGTAWFGGMIAAVPAGLAALHARLWDNALLFASANHRLEIWGFAAKRVIRHPLFGFGLDASRALGNDGDVSQFGGPDAHVIPLHPHNLFLQVWLELGGVGVVLTLALVFRLMAETSRLSPEGRRYGYALMAAALAMLNTAFGIWQTWWMSSLAFAGLAFMVVNRIPARAGT